MTDRTSDDEDFADYTDSHENKPAPEADTVRRAAHTPDVSAVPDIEPPD